MEINKQHLRIERRYSRIETGIPCVVGLPGDELSTCYISDMSEGGLKFSCGHHTICNILPENRRTPDLVTDVLVEIHFELADRGPTALVIKCTATLVHFERLAQDEYHVGVQFVRLDKTMRKGLHAYMQSVLEQQSF